MGRRKCKANRKKQEPKYSSRDFRDSYIQVQGQEPSLQEGYAPFERFQELPQEVSDWLYSSRFNPNDYYDGWQDYQLKRELEDLLIKDHRWDALIQGGIDAEVRPPFSGQKGGSPAQQIQRMQDHYKLIRQDPFPSYSQLHAALAWNLGDGSDMAKAWAMAEAAGPQAQDAPLWIGLFAPFWRRRPSEYQGQDLQEFILFIFGGEGSCIPAFLHDLWFKPIIPGDTPSFLSDFYLYIYLAGNTDTLNRCLSLSLALQALHQIDPRHP